MKYGILGDIHANLEALTAVLDDMKKAGVQKFISVGDIVGYGANPEECLQTVRKLGATIVAGNHDQAVCGILSTDLFNSYARSAVIWTQKNINKESDEFLKSLPYTVDVDGISVSHSSFYAPESYDYIQTSYDAHLSFHCQKTQIGFIGHSHIPIVFLKRKNVSFHQAQKVSVSEAEKVLVNVGAIGQPRDENPDSVCCIYDSETGEVLLKRIKYDVQGAMKKIKAAGLPEILAERLKYGR